MFRNRISAKLFLILFALLLVTQVAVANPPSPRGQNGSHGPIVQIWGEINHFRSEIDADECQTFLKEDWQAHLVNPNDRTNFLYHSATDIEWVCEDVVVDSIHYSTPSQTQNCQDGEDFATCISRSVTNYRDSEGHTLHGVWVMVNEEPTVVKFFVDGKELLKFNPRGGG